MNAQQVQAAVVTMLPSSYHVHTAYSIARDEVLVRVQSPDRRCFVDFVGDGDVAMKAQDALAMIERLQQPQVQADANTATA